MKTDEFLERKETSQRTEVNENYEDIETQIVEFLKQHNIVLDVKTMLKAINLEDKSYLDVLDIFLLKYSEHHKVLMTLYNKKYPYDLEVNKKVFDVKNLKYGVISNNFYGMKFIEPSLEHIKKIATNNNVLMKGLLVDIKYDIDPFVRYLSNLKIGLDIKFYSDNINNVFISINQQSTPLINKVVLYEIYKRLSSPKYITPLSVYTDTKKITIINNKLIERFYSDFSTRDISYCIREYLDRNGYLIHFSTFLIDCISCIIHIQNNTGVDYLRDFLQFKFVGYTLHNNKEVFYNSEDNILVNFDNLKYTVRYPDNEILNRLKYLNREVYNTCYTKIRSSYYKNKDINSSLCFINYKDYDVILSKSFLVGSNKIEYQDGNVPGEVFDYKDSRVFFYYSKATHTLMIKYREEVNRELFIMFIITMCKFNYVLYN